MNKKKVAVVIPARYWSTRFPGKPLALINGKPMIELVYRQAQKALLVSTILVATDDIRVYEAVLNFGGLVAMTRSDHASPLHRLAEVCREYPEFEIVVQLHGDEPLIQPATIDAVVRRLVENPELEMSTIATRITDKAEINSPAIVKVVRDTTGRALYFSRLPIPYCRESDTRAHSYFAHSELYVYRRDILLELASLSPATLETAESLEQLRALEHGINISVVDVPGRTPTVERPEDLRVVAQALQDGAFASPAAMPLLAQTSSILR